MIASFKNFKHIRGNFVIELLLISLLITPFINIVDVAWMFYPQSYSDGISIQTPLSIKILKDFILGMMLCALSLNWRKLTKTNKLIFGSLILILTYLVIISYYQAVPPLIIVSGIRWYLPIFLFPLFDQFLLSKEEFLLIFRRYRIIIILSFIVQVLQILFSSRWGVCGGFGCRASGFFAMPQPMSVFVLLFLILMNEYSEKLKHISLYAISVTGIFLTKSAAGFLGLGAWAFIKAPKKYKIVAAILATISIIFFPIITGRTGYWISPITRLQIFLNIDFFQTIFGSYTNACNNFQVKDSSLTNHCSVPDSFLVSLIGNAGPIIAIFLIGVIVYYIMKSKKVLALSVFAILLIAGSYTEYFPMNIYLPFIIGFQMRSGENDVV